jgi:hypothetical protein
VTAEEPTGYTSHPLHLQQQPLQRRGVPPLGAAQPGGELRGRRAAKKKGQGEQGPEARRHGGLERHQQLHRQQRVPAGLEQRRAGRQLTVQRDLREVCGSRVSRRNTQVRELN